ncbi:MAG TPA: hypothetical protein DIW17_14320, partial [Clostridiales bacterium]|nr:hypothetical protein [Clostridiales bacterium]
DEYLDDQDKFISMESSLSFRGFMQRAVYSKIKPKLLMPEEQRLLCLDLSKETIVNNGSRKIKGALELMPRRCITLGMRQILAVKMIKIYLYCDWQWGVMRKLALEPPTRLIPASLLQLHPNSEMVITEELLNMEL